MKIAITIPTGEKLQGGGYFKPPNKRPVVQQDATRVAPQRLPLQQPAQPAFSQQYLNTALGYPAPAQNPYDNEQYNVALRRQVYENAAKRKPLFAGGGELQQMQGGGEVVGPPHEEGGVPVMEEGTGEEMAEVEGGERIFSIEDTQMLEQAAAQIMELSQQDPAQADEAAKQLGYAVVEMLMRQEQSQQEQMGMGGAQPPPQQTPDDAMMAQAANQFV